MMKAARFFFAVAAIGVAWTAPYSAQQAQQAKNSPPGGGNPAQSFSFDDAQAIRSDGGGVYTAGRDGVSSGFLADGSWMFSLSNKARRSFLVDLTSPVDISDAPMGGLFECTGADVPVIRVYDVQNVAVGTTAYVHAFVRLRRYTFAGLAYYIDIFYGNPQPGVAVTRVSTKQWIMEAQSDVSDGDVGNLVGSHYNSDGSITNDWTAYYHEPFRITLNIR